MTGLNNSKKSWVRVLFGSFGKLGKLFDLNNCVHSSSLCLDICSVCSQNTAVPTSTSTHLNMDNGLIGKSLPVV